MLPHIAPSLRSLILNILLTHQADAESVFSESNDEVPFTLAPTASKGGGAFATLDLPRGYPILTERPLCVWPQSIDPTAAEELFSHLTPTAKHEFMQLANVGGPELGGVLGRRATNAFNVELPIVEGETAGLSEEEPPTHASFLFPRVARINHSCLNNADHAIDWANLLMTVYATVPITAGEEITIEYTSALIQRPRAERLRLLSESFGFDCKCECCSLTGEDQLASDARRQKIDGIVKSIASREMERPDVMNAFERMRVLLEEERYKAMPEFTEVGVSKAFRFYMQMHSAQREAAESQVEDTG